MSESSHTESKGGGGGKHGLPAPLAFIMGAAAALLVREAGSTLAERGRPWLLCGLKQGIRATRRARGAAERVGGFFADTYAQALHELEGAEPSEIAKP